MPGQMGLFCSPSYRDTTSLSANSYWSCAKSTLVFRAGDIWFGTQAWDITDVKVALSEFQQPVWAVGLSDSFKQLTFWEQRIKNLTGFIMMLMRAEAVTTRPTSMRWQKGLCGVSFANSLDWVAVPGGEIGQENWCFRVFPWWTHHFKIAWNSVSGPGPLGLNSKWMLKWQLGVRLNFR